MGGRSFNISSGAFGGNLTAISPQPNATSGGESKTHLELMDPYSYVVQDIKVHRRRPHAL